VRVIWPSGTWLLLLQLASETIINNCGSIKIYRITDRNVQLITYNNGNETVYFSTRLDSLLPSLLLLLVDFAVVGVFRSIRMLLRVFGKSETDI